MAATDIRPPQTNHHQSNQDAAKAALSGYLDVLDAISRMSPAMQLDVAHFILRDLRDKLTEPGSSSLEQAQAMLDNGTPPPDDEETRRILEQVRAERYA
jgi:hypothetical protein